MIPERIYECLFHAVLRQNSIATFVKAMSSSAFGVALLNACTKTSLIHFHLALDNSTALPTTQLSFCLQCRHVVIVVVVFVVSIIAADTVVVVAATATTNTVFTTTMSIIVFTNLSQSPGRNILTGM